MNILTRLQKKAQCSDHDMELKGLLADGIGEIERLGADLERARGEIKWMRSTAIVNFPKFPA